MNCLAIDTSSKHLTVVCFAGENTSVCFKADCALNHSVELMDAVEDALCKAGIDICEVDLFAVVIGAGSFTGIRIGVATIKGFATARNKKIVPLTSFDVLAYNTSGDLLAVVDAGRGYFYACGYNSDKRITLEPSYLSLEQLKQYANEYSRIVSLDNLPVAFELGDAVEGLKEAVKAKAAVSCEPEDVCALYIKKSQAEENRK